MQYRFIRKLWSHLHSKQVSTIYLHAQFWSKNASTEWTPRLLKSLFSLLDMQTNDSLDKGTVNGNVTPCLLFCLAPKDERWESECSSAHSASQLQLRSSLKCRSGYSPMTGQRDNILRRWAQSEKMIYWTRLVYDGLRNTWLVIFLIGTNN